MLKNNAFLNRFLLEFSSLWLPKMEWKFNVFWIFIEKADFVKIIVFLKENCYFSGSELPKIDKISMSKRFRKWHRKKKALKSNLGIDFGLPKPLKLLQKAMLNEACIATLWKSFGNRRKSTGPSVCEASDWLRIWLGLLDLPLVALIIKVRFATWHAPRIFLLTRRGNQKTSSRGTKIHESRAPIA